MFVSNWSKNQNLAFITIIFNFILLKNKFPSWLAMRIKLRIHAKILLVIIVTTMFLLPSCLGLQLTATYDYTTNVHTYVNSGQGNITYVDKPFFPVMINNSQIQIGQNWTIVVPLEANHDYHVYCYGTWVNTSSAAKTDYDIYVFNPQGNLESYHTEAAGFPEHLGTTTDDPFFAPKQSGNYSFVIKNDLRESEGSQQATFMIIENLRTDVWNTALIDGKQSNGLPSFRTSWAYELMSNASYVELYVKVPHTLDMYEARLYLMNDAKSLSINSYPIPWEPGLYANISSKIGGYNFESEGSRGVAYASCEYAGKAMFLNYSSTNKFTNLYHLVLIGEEGSGEIQFMLKTNFANESLLPVIAPKTVLAGNATEISYSSISNSLEHATCYYTLDNWSTQTNKSMSIFNHTCSVIIPAQEAGSIIQYRIEAVDSLCNVLNASGNYAVKMLSTLNSSLIKETIQLGENITVSSILNPITNTSKVELQIYGVNFNRTLNCILTPEGTFQASFQPPNSGNYSITASSPETPFSFGVTGPELFFSVTEPPLYIKYFIPIIGMLVALSVSGGLVYFFKLRTK